jgi:DNA-binding cell septation regulator SpoVG
MNGNYDINVRAFPVKEPKGNTLGYANITIDGLIAIRGVRIVKGTDNLFVSMPQTKGKGKGIDEATGKDKYHDTAHPIVSDLRHNLNAAVLQEYQDQLKLEPDYRGYPKEETGVVNIKALEDVRIDAKLFPLENPAGKLLAFAGVSLNDIVAINGLRVVDGAKGLTVTMPQAKDKEGKLYDVAFPINGDVRRAISAQVLQAHKTHMERGEHKQGIGEKLAAGAERAAQAKAAAPQRPVPQMAAAKTSAPGLD